jgi:hypothetical protein
VKHFDSRGAAETGHFYQKMNSTHYGSTKNGIKRGLAGISRNIHTGWYDRATPMWSDSIRRIKSC